MIGWPTYDLGGRTAMVTGGASGIGRACSLRLAESGAIVVVCDLDGAAAEQTALDITAAGGTALAVQLDVTDEVSVEHGTAVAAHIGSGLSMAVNCAGIGGGSSPTRDVSKRDWDQVLAVNLTGMFLSLRAQVGAIADAGGGAVVNIGSVMSQVGSQTGSVAYVAAKHGVIGLTKQAALDHAAQGIRVNAVLPGYINTPLVAATFREEQLRERAAKHPIGRCGEPGEVAELVTWLVSDAASFVTASSFAADGGFLAL